MHSPLLDQYATYDNQNSNAYFELTGNSSSTANASTNSSRLIDSSILTNNANVNAASDPVSYQSTYRQNTRINTSQGQGYLGGGIPGSQINNYNAANNNNNRARKKPPALNNYGNNNVMGMGGMTLGPGGSMQGYMMPTSPNPLSPHAYPTAIGSSPYGAAAPMPMNMPVNVYKPLPGPTSYGLSPRVINTYFLDILKENMLNGPVLNEALNAYIESMDSVNLATILFHTGKKKFQLLPQFIQRIAIRFHAIDGEFRAREASNALYGLRCMSSDTPEVRLLVKVLANKLMLCNTVMVAQAVGNALYGIQVCKHSELLYLCNSFTIVIVAII